MSGDNERLQEACGVVGIYGHSEAAKLAYLGVHALQHRGQESAGICSSDGRELHLHKAMGLVADVFTAEALSRLPGSCAIGHTRYSTAGESSVRNAQPIFVHCNKGSLAIAHNGNLLNAVELKCRLENDGHVFQTTSDTEVILQLVASSRQDLLIDAVKEALGQLEGAFSIVILARERMFAARDPRGFRPLSLGRLPSQGGGVVFASETAALDLIGAEFVRDVQPGELVEVGPTSMVSHRYHAPVPPAQCIFELVYFARPDSVVFGRSVALAREEMGRLLAREAPADADLVVPVPDSGTHAAVGYAAESGLGFHMGLVRSHYMGRTFIEPEQRLRDFGVKLKLSPVRSMVEGRRVVLIDDSIVRGTTSQKIVRLLFAAGAAQVHVRISSPPFIAACRYGIDTPSTRELIAANHSIEQVREFIGATSLAYLSLPGLLRACGDEEGQSFCTSCFSGRYPEETCDCAPERSVIAAAVGDK